MGAFPNPPLAPEDIAPGEALRLDSSGTGWEAFTPASAEGPLLRAFPFAFDTPELLTGAPLYVPPPGDELLNAWVKVGTPWNGTTPRLDMGYGPAGNVGIMGAVGATQDMTVNDGVINSLLVGSFPDLAALSAVQFLTSTSGSRLVPSEFNADPGTPFTVWVTQNGANDGADPGSSAGAAVLYLVTVTPP